MIFKSQSLLGQECLFRGSRIEPPGRLNPTSTASGLFVVAKATIPSGLTTLPSKISVNAATARVFKFTSSPPSPELPPEFCTFSPLDGHNASSSSIKTIAGFQFRRSLAKTSRMASSISPTTEPTSSGPSTTKESRLKFQPRVQAKSVLPVPGGPPNQSTSGGWRCPHFLKRSALTSGSGNNIF